MTGDQLAGRTNVPAADPHHGAKTRVERAVEELRAAVENCRACGVPFGEMNGLLGRLGVEIGMVAPTWRADG